MRALLDTNIVIHRESMQATNYSIGQLYYWLDKLHYEKLIHPFSINELRKANNSAQQAIYDARLSAYTQMKTVAVQTDDFKAALVDAQKTENDMVDNQLLYEVYCGRADILITEDRKMRNKAEALGINDKVFTINSFVTKMTEENPELIDYKALSVKKVFFGNVDVKDPFFDTFRSAYEGFEKWFTRKSNEEAYICFNDKKEILGFLYLKTEYEDENYADIFPRFAPKKRLKVGTFKVESSRFRLGERFIKIIFDNALERRVEEIYVTLYTNRPELLALKSLLERWGFFEYGKKIGANSEELVMVKRIGEYNQAETPRYNFPNIRYDRKKLILPIIADYHTRLFPDSKLSNEVEITGEEPQKYALQKVYISFSFARNMAPGDIVLIYRNGTTPGRKKFESVITTVCIVSEFKSGFLTEKEYIDYCENRTVFTKQELHNFWVKKNGQLLVLRLIDVKALKRKITLGELWDRGIVEPPSGPRPFDQISDEQFDEIIESSETSIRFQGLQEKDATIMLAIKPKYVEQIFAGKKKYEFRRKLAGTSVSKILIYETSPVSKVVGEAQVIKSISLNKTNLWSLTKQNAGLSKEEFDMYFSNVEIACAYELGEVKKYSQPKLLSDYGIEQAPQSFIYMNNSEKKES